MLSWPTHLEPMESNWFTPASTAQQDDVKSWGHFFLPTIEHFGQEYGVHLRLQLLKSSRWVVIFWRCTIPPWQQSETVNWEFAKGFPAKSCNECVCFWLCFSAFYIKYFEFLFGNSVKNEQPHGSQGIPLLSIDVLLTQPAHSVSFNDLSHHKFQRQLKHSVELMAPWSDACHCPALRTPPHPPSLTKCPAVWPKNSQLKKVELRIQRTRVSAGKKPDRDLKIWTGTSKNNIVQNMSTSWPQNCERTPTFFQIGLSNFNFSQFCHKAGANWTSLRMSMDPEPLPRHPCRTTGLGAGNLVCGSTFAALDPRVLPSVLPDCSDPK